MFLPKAIRVLARLSRKGEHVVQVSDEALMANKVQPEFDRMVHNGHIGRSTPHDLWNTLISRLAMAACAIRAP